MPHSSAAASPHSHSHPHRRRRYDTALDPVERAANRRRLTIALCLAASYMLAEAVGGYLTGSLALLADAGHMLSDVGALGLALFALWLAQRRPTSKRTYGFHRAEILAALANGAVLVAIALAIFVEAFERLRDPRPVEGPLMMAIAAGGMAVNLASLWVLSPGRSQSLNVRGAWLHVLSDTLGSAQAVVAGLLIWTLGWTWADPLASMLIGVLLVYSSWNLLKEAVGVLMEGSPGHLDVDAVRQAILGVVGVAGVHDLHLWTLTSGREALSGHIEIADGSDSTALLAATRCLLQDRFGVDHVTLQVEPVGFEERGRCD